jgi:hypothetical protein
MSGDRVIRAVDCKLPTFVRGLKRLSEPLQTEVIASLRSVLLLDLSKPSRKLHLHQLTNKKVPSALNPLQKVNPFSIHVTANDKYKASFTLENGTAYFRVCDEHDIVDKNP